MFYRLLNAVEYNDSGTIPGHKGGTVDVTPSILLLSQDSKQYCHHNCLLQGNFQATRRARRARGGGMGSEGDEGGET
jgi:hypothetical protein